MINSNSLLTRLPEDATILLFGFLTNNEVIAVHKKMCKAWKNSLVIQTSYEQIVFPRRHVKLMDEIEIIHRFPKWIVDLFRQCKRPIETLPLMGLPQDPPDNVDSNYLYLMDAPHSLMRVSWEGQLGISFRVYAKIFSRFTKSVFFYFEHPPSNEWRWDSTGDAARFRSAIHLNSSAVHNPRIACPTCPFVFGRPSRQLLIDLLTERDIALSFSPRAPTEEKKE